MSNKVDERITRIRFDNDQFERGVATSMQSLDRLKNKLEDTESSSGFSGMASAIENISKKFNTLHMVAVDVLGDIASNAISAGTELVKSLSVDNITEGWSKYEREVAAVQSMMHTLGDTASIEKIEKELKYVAWYSDETSYSYDQMSNAMGRMINNGAGLEEAARAVVGLGNAAASAGVSTANTQGIFEAFSNSFARGYMMLNDWRRLETVLLPTPEIKQQIMDIAVALGKVQKVGDDLYHAAGYKEDFTSGGLASSLTKGKWFDQEVILAFAQLYSEFSEQVYNFQQLFEVDTASSAMAYMNDIGSSDFRKNLLKTAASLGKIYQAENGVFYLTNKMLSDEMIDASNMLFGEWLDPEVLNAAISKYDKLSQDTLDFIDERGLKTLSEVIKYLDEAGVTLDSVSAKAFVMGQEAITLTQALESVKDAVSTKWKDTFKELFGNYNEAKELWTDLSNELYELFAASGDVRNEILNQWNNPEELFRPDDKRLWDIFDFPELESGRDVLLAGLWNIFESIKNVIDAIKEAWREVFPEMTAMKLYRLTVKFRDFTEKIKKSTEDLDTLKIVLRGIFKILRAGLNVFKKVLSFAKELWPIGKKLLEIIVAIGKQVFQFFSDAAKHIKGTEKFGGIIEKITKFLNNLRDAILNLNANDIKLPTFDEFLESIKKVKDNLGGFKDKFSEVFKTISDKVTNFLPGKKMEEVGEYLTLVATDADGSSSIISRAFSNYNMLLADSEDNTETILGKLKRVSKTFFTWVGDQFKDFKLDDLIGVGIIMVLSKFVWNLGDLSKQLGGILSSVSSLISQIGGVFTSLSNLLQKKVFTEISKAVRNFALSVLAIAGAIWLIASIKGDVTEAIDIVLNMVIGLVMIHTIMTFLSQSLQKKSIINITGFNASGFNITKNSATGGGGLVGLAIAVLAMVTAFAWLNRIITKNGLTSDQINKIRWTIILLASSLTACIAAMYGVSILANRLGGAGFKRPSSFAPLGFALSLLTMIAVFKKLDTMHIENIWGVIGKLALIFATLSGMAFAFGNIAADAGIGMLGFVGSLWLMLLLFKRMESLDLKIGDKVGIFAVVLGLFTVISLFLRRASVWGTVLNKGQKFKKFGANVIGIIAVLSACIAAMWVLSSLTTEQLVKTGITTFVLISAIFTGFSFMLNQIGKAGPHAGKGLFALTSLIAIMGIFVIAITAIGKYLGWENVGIAVLALGAIIVMIIAIGRQLDGLKLNVAGIASLAAFMLILAGCVVGLSYLLKTDFETTLAAVGLLCLGLISIGGMFALMSTAFSSISKTSLGGIIKQLIMFAGIVAVFGTLIWALSTYVNGDNLAFLKDVGWQLLAIIVVLTGISVLFGLLGKAMDPVGALKAMAAFIIVTAVIAGIAIGLLYLFDLIDRSFTSKGKNLLEVIDQCVLIAYGLGSIVGALYAGVFTGAAPMVADSLSKFATNLKPFIEVVTDIPDGFGKKVSGLGVGLTALSGGTWLTKIVDWLSGKGDIIDQAVGYLNGLVPLFTEGGLFQVITTVGNLTAIDQGMSIIERLPDAVTGLNNIKTGKLSTVFEDLDTLTHSLVDLGTTVKEVTAEASFDPSSIALISDTISELGTSLSSFSTSEGSLYDVTSINGFIREIGEVMASFVVNTASVTSTTVTKSEHIRKILDNFLGIKDDVGKNKGFGAWLEGSTDFGEYGRQLGNFVSQGLKPYVDALTEYSPEYLKDASDKTAVISPMLKEIGELGDSFEKNSGLSYLFGSQDYGQFGKQIASLAKNLKTYATTINDSGIDWEKTKDTTEQAIEIINSIANTKNTEEINSFTDALKNLALNGINGLYDYLTSEDTRVKMNDAVKRISDMISHAGQEITSNSTKMDSLFKPIIDSIISYFSNAIEKFKEIGKNLVNAFVSGFSSEANSDKVKTAILGLSNFANNTLTRSLKIKSPSRVWMEYGMYTGEGYAIGIDKSTPIIVKSVNNLSTAIDSAAAVGIKHFGETTNETFTEVAESSTETVVDKAKNIIKGAIDSLLNSDGVKTVKDGIGSLAGTVKDGINDATSSLTSGVTSLENPLTFVSDLFNPDKEGNILNDLTSTYTDQLQEYMDSALGDLTLDATINPVITDDSDLANWSDLLNNNSLGATLKYSDTDIPELTQAIIRLEDKVAILSDALKNQRVDHTGEIQVRYTNESDFVDHIQTMIINNIRKEVRG